MELFKKYADLVLLAHFLRNPSGKFYVKELAKKLGLSPSSVSIASRKFERDGVLKSEKSGLAKFYTLNNESTLVRAFKVTYALARLNDVRPIERFLGVDSSIISIALYGSYASGAYGERSDLNLLVVSQKGKDVYKELKRELEEELGLGIRLEVFNLGEWKERVKTDDPLYREVLSNQVPLFGSSLV